MKVLQVINSFKGGGAEILTLDLHEGYLNRGIDSHAVSLEDSTSKLPNTYTIGMRSCYQLSVIVNLFLFLNQPQWKNLDIIHVHLFPSQLLIPFICKIIGIKAKLVTTEHNTVNYRINTFVGRIIDSLFYNDYQKIICNSQGTLKMMTEWQSKLSARMSVIYNGIKISKYKREYSPLTSIDPIDDLKSSLPIVVSVGRLVEQKNYAPAIRALGTIDRDFEYWIVGTGALDLELKNLVKNLQLEHKIKFLGFRDDVPHILSQADIFLQTSLWEGFGLAVVEGMAAGLPVVVSDVPGVKEVVGNTSECGFLVNPLSEVEIAEKVTISIDNPSLRKTMGENAKTRSGDFDIERAIEEHLVLYRSVCEVEASFLPSQLNNV